jgi:hypothetical protein
MEEKWTTITNFKKTYLKITGIINHVLTPKENFKEN